MSAWGDHSSSDNTVLCFDDFAVYFEGGGFGRVNLLDGDTVIQEKTLNATNEASTNLKVAHGININILFHKKMR